MFEICKQEKNGDARSSSKSGVKSEAGSSTQHLMNINVNDQLKKTIHNSNDTLIKTQESPSDFFREIG